MSAKAKAVRTLYRAKRITIDGVRKAVADGLITAAEYTEITGEVFKEEHGELMGMLKPAEEASEA